jgi:hypothetical protein
MNENFEEYRDLVQLMKATPKAPTPDRFTQNVMGRLTEPPLTVWRQLLQSLKETREISWTRFSLECAAGQTSSLYFLLAGLFFFFIGTILLTSLFNMNYLPSAIVSVLVQAVLILVAAISLVAAGLMMATHMPDAHTLAKRAIMVYMVLIIANAFLMQATVKTTVGGLFALTFGVTGILMGVVLMKVLEAQTTETTRFKQGGHQNA